MDEEIIDSEFTKPVYHHIGQSILGDLVGIFFILLMALTIGFIIWAFKVYFLLILLFILTWYYIWQLLLVQKPSFKIYENRIEFYNEYRPIPKEVIYLKDIVQVRYEDEFGKSSGLDNAASVTLIYIYLKENHGYKFKKITKENLVRLLIRENSKVDNIITILKLFQTKKKKIYIATKYKKINEALGLENWDYS